MQPFISNLATAAPARGGALPMSQRVATDHRVSSRRKMYFAQAGSYLIDAILLLFYFFAGTTSIELPICYLFSGGLVTLISLALSEIGFTVMISSRTTTLLCRKALST
jgi:hypothetical protein